MRWSSTAASYGSSPASTWTRPRAVPSEQLAQQHARRVHHHLLGGALFVPVRLLGGPVTDFSVFIYFEEGGQSGNLSIFIANNQPQTGAANACF